MNALHKTISISLMLMCMRFFSLQAQPKSGILLQIEDGQTHQPVVGASVVDAANQRVRLSDAQGIVHWDASSDFPLLLRISCIGYQPQRITLADRVQDTFRVFLEPASQALEQVVITATRVAQPIADLPTHVQVVDEEDIEEGTAMSPGNIRELLTELSGTQIQQTSAVSGYASIRLLGLDGVYTQLLKDGFPLYGGLSGSLSMLQIPPLDLQRVEVIKGASSALYGGDAIAGVINLVSKQPSFSPLWTLVVNQTHKGGTDLGSYFSHRNRRLGTAWMADYSLQQPFDVNSDGFSDLPFLRQFTMQPSGYIYFRDSSQLQLTTHLFHELRKGGDMQAIKQDVDSLFLQESTTTRLDAELQYQRRAGTGMLAIKTSGVVYQRQLNAFKGRQYSSYSEISYAPQWGKHQWVGGLNVLTDRYLPGVEDSLAPPAYDYLTLGLFLQDDWRVLNKLTLEAGFRLDRHNRYGYFLLPRLMVLWKPLPGLQLRGGLGWGYKIPSFFNAQAEEDGYLHLISPSGKLLPAKALSISGDIYYHRTFANGLSLSVDQGLYVTQLRHALVDTADQTSFSNGAIRFLNAPAPVFTTALETNVHLEVSHGEAYLGYTFLHAIRKYDLLHPQLPLMPRGRFVSTWLWHFPEGWKFGLEGFYTGHQYLDDGSLTRSYWTFDVMVAKTFSQFTILGNVENITDARQSRWGPLFTGSRAQPRFQEIYAPLDGRVINVSVKWNILGGKDEDD